ncbi:MAG: hypothetical protein HRT51_06720 [Colwellia sp.]|nr:hypothetical protein [Colwellia sp.]
MMPENETNMELLAPSEYILSRMVYINSAGHAYSEINIACNIAMFGDNNKGKTATLAGTKLLLFPETDFSNCENKFKFEGKKGLYSAEDSYDFYFPDPRSFIILEVENPRGRFCMVLYKKSNYGYGRFFIPVEYEDLKPLFWDKETNTFNPSISINSVSQFCKKHKGEQLSDTSKIADLMFASYRQGPDKSRFCVVPLKDARKESIDAFRNIFQLAFETGQSEVDSMPEAMAALLEMGRSREQERLDANLTQLADEHSVLVKKRDWLQQVQNSEQQFSLVTDLAKTAQQKLEKYSIDFHSINHALISAKETFVPEHHKISLAHSGKVVELTALEESIGELILDKEKLGAVNISKATSLDNKNKQLLKGKKIVEKYPGYTMSEIMAIFEESLESEQGNLLNYQSEEGRAKSLQANINKKNQLIEEIKGLTGLLKNKNSSLLHQLNHVFSSDVLYTLNNEFRNVILELSDEQRNIILSFTNLFERNKDNNLRFLGQILSGSKLLKADLETSVEDWGESLTKKKNQLDDVTGEIDELAKAITNANIEKLIQTTEAELTKIKNEKIAIGAIEQLEKELIEIKNEIIKNTNENKEKEIKLKAEQELIDKVKADSSTLHNKLKNLDNQKANFDLIENQLKSASSISTANLVDKNNLVQIELTQQVALDVVSSVNNYKNSFNKLSGEIIRLQSALPHPDLDNHKDSTSLRDCQVVIENYQNSFATLQYDFKQLNDSIRGHNQFLNNQLNELKDAKELLANFVLGINQELNTKTVSNLSEIELKIELNTSFESLMDTLGEHSIIDDSLLEPEFYDLLSSFIHKYFNKKTRRLKMKDIIASVNYQYRLADTGELVTKSQSGGTTTAITAFVLSVLLQRITSSDTVLRMPVIVDEIGTLDAKNTDAIINQITAHGFSIYCATPKFDALVSKKVGNYVMIDQSMIKEPMVKACHMNILPEHIERFGANKSET